MDPVSDVLRPLWRILRTTAQLWWKHWPALLVISILAWAGHEFFLSLAVFSTRTHALLSFLILKEAVGPRRWAAVAVGFVGVLVVMRPGGEGVPAAGLGFGLAAAVLSAGVTITLRQLRDTEHVAAIVFWFFTA